MIDWLDLLTNGLWILGLAICLTALGFADWQAHATASRLRAVLATPRYQTALWGGLALVGLGAALSNPIWWERAAWAAVALLALYTALSTHRARSAR